MKNRWIHTAAILLLASIMAYGQNAQGPGDWQGKRQGQEGPRFHQKHRQHGSEMRQKQRRTGQHLAIEFSEEQKEELKTLKLEHHKLVKPLRYKMAELKARERTLMAEEKVDLKAVHKVIDEQTALTNQMKKLSAEHRVKVKSIFTDEQLMKLEGRRKAARSRRASFS